MVFSSLQSAIIGGVCIGLAASWLYLSIGRIAGISGIAAQAISRATLAKVSWPLLFIIGLGLGGWIATLLTASGSGSASNTPAQASAALSMTTVSYAIHWPQLILGGLLVGFGTRMGSGCTSGHGVCGIARVSTRSIAATCVFLGVGMLVATTIASF